MEHFQSIMLQPLMPGFLTDPSQWALKGGSALLSHLTDEVSKGLGWLARSHTSVLEPLSFNVGTLTVESALNLKALLSLQQCLEIRDPGIRMELVKCWLC